MRQNEQAVAVGACRRASIGASDFTHVVLIYVSKQFSDRTPHEPPLYQLAIEVDGKYMRPVYARRAHAVICRHRMIHKRPDHLKSYNATAQRKDGRFVP